ncbi:bacteriohemerythrin [Desulforamulus putei]|uniref:Hemerythrin n=1 Tax=Desulforamulus putei DSM 12395 TaxID=1121429 RepID=A0A1M4VKL0_9FIRM|nr:hemerythrin family protein [Desulforamulus putei]SHE69524.1 hemerythrin [Desulforamulus putei DSM 12395]
MWKEKYRIGVELIDEQHKELFRRVTEFIKTVQSQESWEKKLVHVQETLEFMKDYVVIHFADEETYQAEIAYPEREKHQATHEQFKAEIEKYVAKLNDDGYNEETVKELGGRLLAWLVYHVAGDDQKIGRYVAQGKVVK